MATTQVIRIPLSFLWPLLTCVLFTWLRVQHYLWAGGHFLLLVAALRYFIACVTFTTVSAWWYKGMLYARSVFRGGA